MKTKIFTTLFTLFFSIILFSQSRKTKELAYLVLENAKYNTKNQTIKFDIVIKNASKDTMYFIEPQNYFFRSHKKSSEKNVYYDIYNSPYKLSLAPYPNCYELAKEEAAIDAVEALDSAATPSTNDTQNSKLNLYKEVVALVPGAYKKYKNIVIDYSLSGLCENTKYKINVTYNFYEHLNYTTISHYRNLVKNNDIEEINTLFNGELEFLKSEKLSNIDNLKELIKMNDFFKKNGYEYIYSNKVDATEKK